MKHLKIIVVELKTTVPIEDKKLPNLQQLGYDKIQEGNYYAR